MASSHKNNLENIWLNSPPSSIDLNYKIAEDIVLSDVESDSDDELMTILDKIEPKGISDECALSIGSTEKNKPERRPTRKPDPNTKNRNALMARENRKKKKDYVAQLEHIIEQNAEWRRNVKNEINKIVKKKNRAIRKLKKQNDHYKIMLNRSSMVERANLDKSQNFINGEAPLTPETSPLRNSADCLGLSLDEIPDMLGWFDRDDNIIKNNNSLLVCDPKVNEYYYNLENIKEHSYSTHPNNCNEDGLFLSPSKCSLRSQSDNFPIDVIN